MDRFDEKLRGPLYLSRNMRRQIRSLEKHLPIKTGQEQDEGSRV